MVRTLHVVIAEVRSKSDVEQFRTTGVQKIAVIHVKWIVEG